MHIFLIAITLVLAIASNTVLAQSKNIGFVNISVIMQKIPQAEEAKNRLEEEFSDKDEELTQLENRVSTLKSKFSRSAKKLSSSEKSKLKKNIAAAQRKFRTRKEEIRELFGERRREELSNLQELVYEVVKRLAKTKKIDLVVTEPVLYASERINLTKAVIKVLKKRAK